MGEGGEEVVVIGTVDGGGGEGGGQGLWTEGSLWAEVKQLWWGKRWGKGGVAMLGRDG